MDRRDLLNGINDFLSDSIVLPPGDFDKELLLPIVETAKIKNTQAKRRSTRLKKRNNDRSNDHQQQQSQPQCKFSIYFFFSSLKYFLLATRVLLGKSNINTSFK
jgi:hypothetical protein